MGSADDPHVGIPASDNGAGRFVSTAMNGSGGTAARTNGRAATNGHVNGHDHSGMHLPVTGSSRVLVLKERAEMLERGEGALHSERLEMARPCVIRLHRYVRIPRDVHRRKITRKAVLARDAWTCQYCGRQAAGLTVDHVIPRSRGGDSEWDNIVAACAPCNRRKGNRTPREARMHPATRPKPPGPTVFIRIASPRIPVAWESYLGLAAA